MSTSNLYNGYFQAKTGIITGAASGIGAELARQLLDAGATICVADWNEHNLEQIRERFRDYGTQASFAKVDVADQNAVHDLVNRFANSCGKLDLIFNNAGILQTGPVEEISRTDWERIMNINFWGVVNGCYAAMPIMIAQGFGHIVNTASLGGIFSFGFQVSYGTTKFAVMGFSEGLRYELQRKGIYVTTLCPGDVRSNLYDNSLSVTDPSSEQKGKLCQTAAPATSAETEPDFYEQNGSRCASAPFACREILSGVAEHKAFVITPHDYVAETFLMEKYCRYYLQPDDILAGITTMRAENYAKTGNIYISELPSE